MTLTDDVIDLTVDDVEQHRLDVTIDPGSQLSRIGYHLKPGMYRNFEADGFSIKLTVLCNQKLFDCNKNEYDMLDQLDHIFTIPSQENLLGVGDLAFTVEFKGRVTGGNGDRILIDAGETTNARCENNFDGNNVCHFASS